MKTYLQLLSAAIFLTATAPLLIAGEAEDEATAVAEEKAYAAKLAKLHLEGEYVIGMGGILLSPKGKCEEYMIDEETGKKTDIIPCTWKKSHIEIRVGQYRRYVTRPSVSVKLKSRILNLDIEMERDKKSGESHIRLVYQRDPESGRIIGGWYSKFTVKD